MEKSFEAVKEVEEAGCLLIKTFVERERERRQKTVFVKFHNFNIEILKLESERYEIVIIKKQVSANSKYLNMSISSGRKILCIKMRTLNILSDLRK